MTEKERVIKRIDKCAEEYVEFLKKVISADTRIFEHGKHGNEDNGQKIIEEFLKSYNAEVDVFSPEYEEMNFCPEVNPGHFYEGRHNVVGRFAGEGEGKSLLFNGHIDTVDYGDVNSWTRSPVEPYSKGGRLFGRGACDMKGGLCAALMAIKAIRDCGIKLKGDVIYESVIDEEGGGNGTLSCCARGYHADAGIIPEPSDLWLAPAHMGWLIYEVEVEGRANHCGAKYDGVNAIEKMVKIIQGLQEAEREWALTRRHPYLPPQSLSIDTIKGGTASTIVPDNCKMEFIVHFQPHYEAGYTWMGEKYDNEVREIIGRVAAGDEWLEKHPPKITLYQLGSACDIGMDHPICVELSGNTQEIIGRKPKCKGLASGADGRLLNNYANTPTVHFGPGSMEIAHSVNEFVPIREYIDCIKIFAGTILDWCEIA